MKRKILLILASTLFLSGCNLFNFASGSLRKDYGTIKKFLDHSPNGAYNYISTRTYLAENHSSRYYDTTNKLYDALYEVKYREISKEEGVWNKDEWLEYSIPYDDAAYIQIKESGSGLITVRPDLDFGNLGFTTYIQLDIEDAKTLINLANEMLSNFYDA